MSGDDAATLLVRVSDSACFAPLALVEHLLDTGGGG
jgi:hypothetical protein